MVSPWLVVLSQAQRIATADVTHSRDTQRVTVNVDQVPLVTALRAIAHEAGLVPVFNESIIPASILVTLHVRDIAVSDAFQQALRGTGLMANLRAGESVAILRDVSMRISDGTITGKVTDAKTQLPLRGAKIGIDGSDRVTETADDGTFRLTGISVGSHTLTVKLLGHTKVAKTVDVQDNAAVTVDVALNPSATPLEQVVVTGTVILTELKAVPNAITVITAKQMEERGITKIDQLFRGDVPGLFAQNSGSAAGASLDEVTMFSRGATALSTSSAGVSQDPNTFVSFLTNPIKTYVDGIELADSKYLSQIDPKSIERIEILAGPQASTIYGSNAINGVMQIFTKRGTTVKPQLTLNLLSGFVQNDFSSALTPQHDYSANLSGVEGRLSYNAGGSWNYMGPWTPAKQLARTGGFGGARLDLPTPAGRVSADMTLRRTLTQSLQRGDDLQKATADYESGYYTSTVVPAGLARPTTRTLAGQTLGLTLSYAPATWWSHDLNAGFDASDVEIRRTAPGYMSVNDTVLSLTNSHTDRRSLRYATTARVPVTAYAQVTFTAGADAWQNLTSSWQVSPQTLTGSLIGSTTVSRQPGHNTGGFLQTQLGMQDRLFVTYGLRAEWNPNFGADAQPNYAPRYGVAYTQELGFITAKLRGAYGRSTRPPQPTLSSAQTIIEWAGNDWFSFWQPLFEPYWGVFNITLANPDLTPEHQQGGEGGLEVYVGTYGSLAVTRYNQTVDGLIAQLLVDSVRTSIPCETFSPECFYTSIDVDGYGYTQQYQYLNVGSIRNQGWELQGSLNSGPLTTRGTYSWTKSRVIGVTQKYRALVATDAQYQPGAPFKYLPEHTWALGVTYARASSSLDINVTGTGQVRNRQNDFYFQHMTSSIRLSQNRQNISNNLSYINFNPPYALADLVASHRFSSKLEALLQIQNLADRYTNDYYAAYASLGRQVKFGARLRTQ